MSEKDPLDLAETGDLSKFSKLEATLVHTEVERRPNSISQDGISRHAMTADIGVNELDFDFNLATEHYPLGDLRSLQQVFDAVQYHQHLEREENFTPTTRVECFKADSQGGEWRALDEANMDQLLQSYATNPSPTIKPGPGRNMLVLWVIISRRAQFHTDLSSFLPLVATEGTSYGSRVRMTQRNAKQLLETLQVNPLFMLNMIGRPDYWAPQAHWEADSDGKLLACDLFCQHPRWNLQVQGAPLSVYVRHDITRDLTTYIISHKEFDTSIATLKSILNIALNVTSTVNRPAIFLDGPFDIHTILSTLSFESSKFHVKRFQRFMWTQMNKVEDHLTGLEFSDRAKLGDLTKQLQIMSSNADSHIANADVAIITAKAIRDAHSRLTPSLPQSNPFINQRAEDSISYIISSIEKQRLWFLNYKQRKDNAMSLVYNLVTQQDAINNIQIAHSMKQDSTSMNAIAALTMIFLPGTFAGTVVGAGVFGGAIKETVWLIWVAITVPLTVGVMICWWLYKKGKQPMVKGGTVVEKDKADSTEMGRTNSFRRRRSSVFSSGFSFRRFKTGIGEDI
ncbi:hypothetical protein N7463_003737 [Penicillium fimorum]|uniref:Mg2+ transporter protein, CorA-like/Zinc transport protein ZntB n=1 Tax=Penicillium fimorum TaxID=1882269 RepID=A0A9W9Y335_9EURO|nr:hypothetical protein N7463_003737 [Penicillium fimorum]